MARPRAAILDRAPAFASADFRRLFMAGFFTSTSRWALMLARGWLVFTLTHSSFAVGVVTFASMVQFIVVGPAAGAVADRVDRRLMALLGGVLLFVSSTALAVLTLTGLVAVWQIVLLAAVDGISVAASQPALQSLVPNVVPREQLLNAVSLNTITRNGSRLIGPLFGGVLLATLGAGSVFALSAFIMLFALASLWRISLRSTPVVGTDARRHPAMLVLSDVGRGFVHVGHDVRLMVVLGCIAFHCGFTMAFDSLLPQLASTVGGGSRTFSAIVMGVGAGAIVATLMVSMIRRQHVQGRALALTGLGSGIGTLVMGLATTPASAVLGAAIAGGTQAAYMAVSLALIQEIVPDEMRGRVMAIYMMLAAGHMALMNLAFGRMADIVGVRPLLIIPGLAWIAVFAAAVIALSELRHVLRRGAFRPVRAFPAPAPDLAAGGGS
jgi:MFS family permease